MPALSSTMKEGKIVSWNKKIGDKVSSGDVLLVVESDKADMDVESFEDGFLAKIITPEGGVAAVGAPVALLVTNKDDVAKASSATVSAAVSSSPAPAAPLPQSTSSSLPSSAASMIPAVVNTGRVIASGWAKTLAEEKGIDLRTVVSTRPDGLITAKDLEGTQIGTLAPVSTHIPAAGVINATPSARKYAAENNLDVTKIKGTGNFGRVTGDDVLIAAGKKSAPAPQPVAVPAKPSSASTATPASGKTAVPMKPGTGIDGVVAMTGMQKAVSKNMEKTLNVPIFRVSRYT
jgi:pyruvate dehydrogenase E2 component (dihydrolipoamide acetyltransferase)